MTCRHCGTSDMTPHARGMAMLKDALSGFVEQALTDTSTQDLETIEGKTERTRRIVADCEAVLRRSPEEISSVVIRHEAGLSALSISEEELAEAQGDPAEETYRQLTRRERDIFVELAAAQVTMKVVLAPPAIRVRRRRGASLARRYETLIRRLTEPDAARCLPPERCRLVLVEPGFTRNVIIIGEQVLYEGVKASIGGGFELTTRVTEPTHIRARIRAFDALYEDAERYTLERYLPGAGDDAASLRKALVIGLQRRFETFQANSDE